MTGGREGGMTVSATPQPQPLTREERLAAKLRENLRRRKAQARAIGEAVGGPEGGRGGADAGSTDSPATLPKPDPSR